MQATTSVTAGARARLWPTLRLDYVRRLPGRIRERGFWTIQVLMLGITGLHYVTEHVWLSDVANVHHIPVTLYLVAVVYAGLFYGLEGGLLTALEAVVLSLPSISLQHRQAYAWIADSAALIAVMGTGALVAWLVEREASQRQLAEASWRRFALLHDVGSAVTHTLELEGVLDDAVQGVARALDADRAWISVWPSEASSPMLRAQVGDPITLCDGQPAGRLAWHVASTEVQLRQAPVSIDNQAIAVPLSVEGRILGALGTACRVERPFSGDDLDLLGAMGNQIAIAIENARLYRDERRMRQSLRDYARRITHAQEEERKRIARELHDDIVQRLVLISRELDELLQASQGGLPCSPSRLAEVHAAIRASAQAVRRFSRDLRPSVLDDLGLFAAIDWLVDDLRQRTGIAATLDVVGQASRLSPQVELHLFRIAQESLRNVERHSHATAVTVTLNYQPERIEMVVHDNGRGFQGTAPSDGSLGVLGMQERVELLGGTFKVESARGQGVAVSVAVPVEPE